MKRIIPLAAIPILLAACGPGNSSNKGTETTATNAQPPMPGKQVFINNCAQCHALKEDKVGPHLDSVVARWNNDTASLIAYIKNAQEVINSGKVPYATELYKKWNGTTMPPFPNLTDADIKDILDYINKGQE